MKKIYVSDFTLKKTEESHENLLFREKTAIASCIDSFGANGIELPEIKNEKEDTIIYKTIAAAVKNSDVCVPVGITEKGIEVTYNAIKDAVKPVLQVSVPVSTATMEYTYHLKAPKMITLVEKLVKKCKEYCENVEFVAEDATRASLDFLCDITNVAKSSGATAVTLCDDVGTSLPNEITELVKCVKEKCDIAVYVSLSDNINTAVASAVSAVTAGADGVKTAIAGDNVLKTDEFCKAVSLKGDALGICTDLKATEIYTDIKNIIKKTNIKKSQEQAADGGVVIDSDSTITEVSEAIKSLGYILSDNDNENVYRALMAVCEKEESVGLKALEAIIASNTLQVPTTYHLESFVCSSGNLSGSMANVVLKINDKILNGVAVGDGPIDAAFRAIEQCMGYHYELDDFQIQSVTEGKEALGSTLVKLRSDGKLYSGNGVSTDIVGASIRAYINAINKIVYEGEQN